MKIKKLPLEEFKRIYSRVPRLCVDLVIQDKRGFVLSKRDIPPAKGKWHLPGGTFYFGEKLEGAAKRIAKAETGLNIKVQKLLDVLEFSPESAVGHTVSIAFLVKPVGGKLRGSFQAKELDFFTQIPKNMIKEQEEFLLKLVAGGILFARM